MAVRGILALPVAVIFAITQPLSGLAWAVAILGAAVALPTPLTFVLGQFGVAATTPTGVLLAVAEVTLAILLASSLSDISSYGIPVSAGGATAGLLIGIVLLFRHSSGWTTLFYLTVTLGSILYGIHRHELYTTAQLQS